MIDKDMDGRSSLKPSLTVNDEQIGISEQFCDDQKVSYYQV